MGAGGVLGEFAEGIELLGDAELGRVAEVEAQLEAVLVFLALGGILKGVREMQGGEWSKFRGEFARGKVVRGDSFDDGPGQSPK